MAIKKIFVNPGDLVVVHVINDPQLSRNQTEWHYSSVRPFKFSFTAEEHGVTFNDPQLDIGIQMLREKRRRIN